MFSCDSARTTSLASDMSCYFKVNGLFCKIDSELDVCLYGDDCERLMCDVFLLFDSIWSVKYFL